MAFRSKAKTCARVISGLALAFPMWAQTGTYEVRHRHLHGGAQGVLRIDADFLSFDEGGKQAKHSRQWKFEDIQELVLAPDTLRIVTYEDERWELGRDRVWVFDRLAAAIAIDWYPIFSKKLDQRFVAALADEKVNPEWRIPVKLTHGRGGSQGALLIGTDGVVYKSGQPSQSRTWRIADIENVASSDPFDLTITTHERDFRFQLKEALSRPRFDELWQRVNRASGLQILSSNKPTGERQ